MEMLINKELIVRLRTEKAWSQQHFADATGLSLRTIQRIEHAGSASSESVLAIASALGVGVDALKPAPAFIPASDKPSTKLRSIAAKAVTAISGIGVGLFLYTSYALAAPVMLDVTIKTDKTELASASLLDTEKAKSEITIDAQLRLLISSEVTPEDRIRIYTEIYEPSDNNEYVLSAKPIVVTNNKQKAELQFTSTKGVRYQLVIRPTL